jgi:hypothetical protein
LDVKLTATGNTIVKASITNTGSTPLNLFNKGTFLDSAAVEKVTVSADGMQTHFFSNFSLSVSLIAMLWICLQPLASIQGCACAKCYDLPKINSALDFILDNTAQR